MRRERGRTPRRGRGVGHESQPSYEVVAVHHGPCLHPRSSTTRARGERRLARSGGAVDEHEAHLPTLGAACAYALTQRGVTMVMPVMLQGVDRLDQGLSEPKIENDQRPGKVEVDDEPLDVPAQLPPT